LIKRGQIVKSWKLRWFTLNDYVLSYYQGQPPDGLLKGQILCENITFVTENIPSEITKTFKNHQNCFIVSSENNEKTRDLILSCESEILKKTWMSKIQECLVSSLLRRESSLVQPLNLPDVDSTTLSINTLTSLDVQKNSPPVQTSQSLSTYPANSNTSTSNQQKSYMYMESLPDYSSLKKKLKNKLQLPPQQIQISQSQLRHQQQLQIQLILILKLFLYQLRNHLIQKN